MKMTAVDTGLLADLEARGLIAQMTGGDEFANFLSSESRTLYCGFDPTADSLHIGSLVPLLTLARFQQAGHKPIALVGGATGLIGDPSFKAQERQLNTPDVVSGWVEKLKAQISAFVEFDEPEVPATPNGADVVNNLDWVGEIDVLTFLRDVGKHFSINNMINKESVKQRIDREGAGISFTEFTYMLLQSYDFAELYKRHNCTLQIGGSDQWGNIVGGVDLAKRMHGGHVFGLTLPLVTKSDGTKFGKTEAGTIWLDAKKTSPYAFYQFWLNSADADAYKFLKYFTFLTVEAIDAIELADSQAQGRPEAQKILAGEVTRLVHGDEGLNAAMRITASMFSGDLASLSETDLEQLKQDGLPASDLIRAELDDSKPLSTILAESKMVSAGREAVDALKRNAVLVNGVAKGVDDNMQASASFAVEAALYGRFYVVKLGKKKYHLFEVV